MPLSEKLLEVASHVQDKYYQDFAPDDSFFRLEDFAYDVATIYGKVADDTAKEIYNNSYGETGIGQLTFSQDWWASKTFEVKKEGSEHFVDLDISYLGFTYDTQNSGIQMVMPVGNNDSLVRTTLTELWQLNHITTTSKIFWYPDGNKLFFRNNAGCNVKKVRVYYLPSTEDENFKLPSSKEFMIASLAWQVYIQAKTGTIIDRTNNGNNNATAQTETDLKQLQPVGV